MIKEKINNTELQRLIALKCNKLDFEEVSDEDIEKIDEISLKGKLINGRMSGIDLDTVQLFPNLVSLSISDLEVTQQFIEDISKLKQLKKLEIVGCPFGEVDFNILEQENINIQFIGCEALPFKYPKVKDINVRGSNLDFESIDFSNVENINITESRINNAYDLLDYKNLKKVNIDASALINKQGEPIDDIKVPEETQYSHVAEIVIADERA